MLTSLFLMHVDRSDQRVKGKAEFSCLLCCKNSNSCRHVCLDGHINFYISSLAIESSLGLWWLCWESSLFMLRIGRLGTWNFSRELPGILGSLVTSWENTPALTHAWESWGVDWFDFFFQVTERFWSGQPHLSRVTHAGNFFVSSSLQGLASWAGIKRMWLMPPSTFLRKWSMWHFVEWGIFVINFSPKILQL